MEAFFIIFVMVFITFQGIEFYVLKIATYLAK